MTDDILNVWRESARYWTKHSDTIHKMFAPLTQALIERAGIQEGQSVLDVAGGAGEPSLTIAETVGREVSEACREGLWKRVEPAGEAARGRDTTKFQFRHCAAVSL